jgi:hypothetical protein
MVPIHPSIAGRCRVKRTVLLVGEGPMEAAFLKYMKNLFVTRSSSVAVQVNNANGGSPETVILAARKLLRQRAYGRCLVLMDTDVPWPPSLPSVIGNTKMTYLPAKPVLEGFLLRILGHPGVTHATAVAACKRELYKQYVNEGRRTDPRAFAKAFPANLFLSSRASCSELDEIMKHME